MFLGKRIQTHRFQIRLIALAIVAIIITCAAFAFPITTHAFTENYTSYGSNGSVRDLSDASSKSVLWSSVITGSICNYCSYGRYYIDNPSVTVQYAVVVTRAKTGERVAVNSTIPAGEHILFRFKPHTSNDIFWFATGHFSSSPYGDWITSQQLGAGSVDKVPSEIGGSLDAVCKTKNRITNTGPRLVDRIGFGSLSINAPVKKINNMSAYNCTPIPPSSSNLSSSVGPIDGGGLDCVFEQPGTINPVFVFEAVSAHFYTNMGRIADTSTCTASGATLTHKAAAYKIGVPDKYALTVPQKTIPFPLNVVAAPTGSTTPTTPNVTSNGGACVAGTAHSISMTATDPEGDTVRYLVDWNNDGAVDQIIPPTGYVASGVAQTTSRIFATTGSKTVRVRAEDSNGTMSAWGSLTFSCAAGPTTATSTAEVGLNGEDEGNGFEDDGSGSLSIDLSLRAIPSIVRSGNTSKVNWTASGVTSCVVTGTNGDSWNGIKSPVGGEVTGRITGKTIYTLTCQSRQGVKTQTAAVNVLPSWQEQ